ncbi:hypothetical protein CHLNCDRAFT_137349 [Chlorella variabilis]|uniref:Translation initiation factor 3 N-terminal domain-containing protein n=1 Tax=Chlorella variabilis TaxID=554065 RepID=E1ZM83_CHLVA|nr:hypothetical protein CHLNCDRAFT_137349 [Chlorella variabilis]EFN52961.1 hypothetical protein CHLNCDRAFT_137349 [Chlorella variabilis]|eukprot:XP_005845063.1 hypothetical protein CHLNCDRAFT_137349 [Chlorella variabilis]
MSAGALVRAARQQGQRRLLAWRQAVADVRLQQPTAGEEAHNTPHSGLQLRGFAIGRAWRPRRKDVMPDRNLPARNEQIKAKEVRVVFPVEEDKPAEVLPIRTAINLAKAQGLDLVMVSPRAQPPVARLVEWSKVLYEQQKREKAATKAKLAQQRAAVAREVRIGCQIAEHDLAVKMAQARRFLEDGSPLRLVVTFKGGQQVALGRDVALYLIGQLTDLCTIKDQKQLQKPLKNQWAVVLVPIPPAALTKPPAKQQQQQQQQTAAQQDKQPEADAQEEEGAAGAPHVQAAAAQ